MDKGRFYKSLRLKHLTYLPNLPLQKIVVTATENGYRALSQAGVLRRTLQKSSQLCLISLSVLYATERGKPAKQGLPRARAFSTLPKPEVVSKKVVVSSRSCL